MQSIGKEQIFSTADAAYDLTPYETEQETLAFQNGFYKGAEWIIDNPDWHKWPEDKPEKEANYLCYIKGGFYVVAAFRNGRWINMLSDTAIIGYMELPKPPKFD